MFEQYPGLNIPNTTNLLDGAFAGLKRRLACHNGMSKENKLRFINDYLGVSNKFTAQNPRKPYATRL